MLDKLFTERGAALTLIPLAAPLVWSTRLSTQLDTLVVAEQVDGLTGQQQGGVQGRVDRSARPDSASQTPDCSSHQSTAACQAVQHQPVLPQTVTITQLQLGKHKCLVRSTF